MTSTRKITVVVATKVGAPVKPKSLEAAFAWVDQYRKVYQLNGYWGAEKAIAYAADRGYAAEEIEHRDLGIAGKAWSQAVDGKFAVINGRPVAVTHE